MDGEEEIEGSEDERARGETTWLRRKSEMLDEVSQMGCVLNTRTASLYLIATSAIVSMSLD